LLQDPVSKKNTKNFLLKYKWVENEFSQTENTHVFLSRVLAKSMVGYIIIFGCVSGGTQWCGSYRYRYRYRYMYFLDGTEI
jgi:hypothetical protein